LRSEHLSMVELPWGGMVTKVESKYGTMVTPMDFEQFKITEAHNRKIKIYRPLFTVVSGFGYKP
jgi:hypothetical protein